MDSTAFRSACVLCEQRATVEPQAKSQLTEVKPNFCCHISTDRQPAFSSLLTGTHAVWEDVNNFPKHIHTQTKYDNSLCQAIITYS